MAYSMGEGLTSPHQFGGVSAALDSSSLDQSPQSTAGAARTAAVQTIATTTASQAARKTSM
jgi:hypothetical protein